MRKTSIRELRHDTSAVLSWVADGETVEVCRRNKPVAILSPLPRKGTVVRPDFAMRLAGVYGPNVLAVAASEIIMEARGEA